MNAILDQWNNAPEAEAIHTMLTCCGARRWASEMAATRPFINVMELRMAADRIWANMEENDLLEAFACHPRIGEREASHGQSAEWSREEQSSVASADQGVLKQIAAGNKEYEDRFGFTYIVCASDRNASELLEILNRRLNSTRDAELREAAEQQRLIMQIRLGKWLDL